MLRGGVERNWGKIGIVGVNVYNIIANGNNSKTASTSSYSNWNPRFTFKHLICWRGERDCAMMAAYAMARFLIACAHPSTISVKALPTVHTCILQLGLYVPKIVYFCVFKYFRSLGSKRHSDTQLPHNFILRQLGILKT